MFIKITKLQHDNEQHIDFFARPKQNHQKNKLCKNKAELHNKTPFYFFVIVINTLSTNSGAILPDTENGPASCNSSEKERKRSNV